MSGLSTSDVRRSSSCCEVSSGSSCAPSDRHGADCCAPTRTTWSKALIFAVVMGAAVAAGTYSFVNTRGSTSDPKGNFVSSYAHAKVGSVLPEREQGARKVLSGLSLGSLRALNTVAADKEAVFILLPGERAELARAASLQLNMVVSRLSSVGKRVGAFTLERNAEGHGQLVQQFAVKSFPCVVVLGRGCTSSAVSGDITRERLFRAYVLASTRGSSCSGCPSDGAAASCCPPK